jgi:hypothetical protein
MFKCLSTDCPTGAQAMEAIGYIMRVTGKSRRDSFVDYLKLAGVWRERARFPARQNLPDSQPSESSPNITTEDAGAHASSGQLPDADVARAAPEGNLPPVSPGVASSNNDNEPSEERCREALCDFYDQLSLADQDELLLFEKRAIESKASQALGFRSNRIENKAALQATLDRFSAEAMLQTGLWYRGDEGLKRNRQFYGWGIKGKLAIMEQSGYDLKDHPNAFLDDDGNVWDWVQPILIPYFNSDGDLFYLRPHKGGIKGQRPHLYVPRTAGRPDERQFTNVLLTEGEFKAASVMQFLPPDWAVAALPGITMCQNYFIMFELKRWLKLIGAKRVTVVYDNEDKSNPALPGYKADPDKRHDVRIWAGVLAEKLHEEMKLTTLVGILPKEMRDENGKADWDSCMARVARST